jgi:hypothetical protein
MIISVGPYGGFYVQNGTIIKQICLGWVSFILLIPEWGDHMKRIIENTQIVRSNNETKDH